MQFLAVEIRFIVTTLLYSTFTNDLKRKYFFRKMFIVTEYAALNKAIGIINLAKHIQNFIDNTII